MDEPKKTQVIDQGFVLVGQGLRTLLNCTEEICLYACVKKLVDFLILPNIYLHIYTVSIYIYIYMYTYIHTYMHTYI